MLNFPVLITLLAAVSGPAVAQTALRPGQTVQGELTTSDPTLGDGSYFDCFSIQTRPGQTLRIDQTSDAFDSYLQAGTGACGTDLANPMSDDDSGGGRNARLDVQGDGSVLIVRANSLSKGMTGQYSLRVMEVGQSPSAGRPPATTTSVAATATGNDPFDTPAIFVGRSAPGSAWFVLPVESRPDGLRRLQRLVMFSTEQSLGPVADGVEYVVDALLTDHLVDCSTKRFRRISVTGYLKRAILGSSSIDEPFEAPEEDMIMADVVKVGCHPEEFDWQTGFPNYASKIARMRRPD